MNSNCNCNCCQTVCPHIPNCFHIPGYSGHLRIHYPNVNTRCGAAYGADGRCIMDNPCVALAPCPVLADPPIYSPPTRSCYGVVVPGALSEKPVKCCIPPPPCPVRCPGAMQFPTSDSCCGSEGFCFDVITTKNFRNGLGLLCTKFTKSNVSQLIV